ncbi:molybdenum ABC transporter ATP-binding protein [Methylobacterium dankookense]|uniref:Sulfate/thiosulfate import ATP-binding protein CysA n=1 Tax=Methylobacterium dankookense TaxID=560405 RepID=A0A564FXV3_9HYPH|nr:molybdenum ABC transporter ATP-binding protein [Methylobacterium dankookense]GJD56537.1 Vitamin B12 import ATP-binding protein BtuD [Methylobacterium dankookense]VUF12704.1 Sulfate/thiosulfate import ATP-binding protein CysA [Methylobacterium dankookense]
MSGLTVAVEHRQGAFRLEAAFAAEGGVTALFGRSGSGKTTLVNVIGGLVRPDRGRVVLDGEALVDTGARRFVPPHRRRIGYVFQESRLFPHLNVRGNLLFGRRLAKVSDGIGFDEVIDLLGIGHLLGRRPNGLSGGERQRVAIGRALLARPRLLLMDEPLAALDEARKAEILPFLERLRDRGGVPIVYVSHALAEVTRLADRMVVLEEGRVVAAGTVDVVTARLDVAPLRGTREAGAVLAARVEAHDPAFALTRLSTAAGPLHVPLLDRPVGASLRILVSARDVTLSLSRPEGTSALNVVAGTVAEIGAQVPADPTAELRLDCGDAHLVVRLTRRSLVEMGLAPGLPVFAAVKTVALLD